MTEHIGFDVKKAAKRFGQQAKKGKVFVMRDENNILTITDGVVVVIGPESVTWEIVKALPSPVPAKVACYLYDHGQSAEETSSSIARVINSVISGATRDIEDTYLTQHEDSRDIRLLAPCDKVGEYTSIDEIIHAIFATAPVVYRQGPTRLAPIGVFHTGTGDAVGAIMPLKDVKQSLYLRSLANASNDTAAD